MPHKFNKNNRHKLDSDERRKMLPPERTIISLGLKDGDVMADIGCGIGYFSIPSSKIVGDNGHIFALDILPEMLEEVEIKARENNCNNIKTVLVEENDLKIKEGSVSFAFISNVLHEIDELNKFLGKVKNIISSKGKIAIIEWKKVNSKYGPPMEDRLDKMELIKLLNYEGFVNIISMDIGDNFYGITAERL
jgi:ubiquinone/menaquinone biosynthesis C-methylase UbiE